MLSLPHQKMTLITQRNSMKTQNQKRRVGRPNLDKDAQQKTRRQIIETAKALFAEEGIEAVSMRKIAAKAGFSQRLPYLYFENKHAILRYIWEDFFTALFKKCDEALKDVEGARDRLEVFLRTYVEYWFDNQSQYELVFLNKDQIGGPDDQYYVEEFGIVGRYDILKNLVQACIEEGTIKSGDPTLYGQTMLCSLHGLLHCLITINEYPWKQREELVDTTLGVLFAGLKT